MNQRGFTLIELLLAMGISSLIMVSVVAAIFQLVQVNSRVNGQATALIDIEIVAHWLTRDMVQAQTTDLIEGIPASQITLDWDDLSFWGTAEGSITHQVAYTLVGTQIQRNFDGQLTTVGDHITELVFTLQGRVISVDVTSSPDGFRIRPSVTRSYDLYLRPVEPI